jgi:hypothetical protein
MISMYFLNVLASPCESLLYLGPCEGSVRTSWRIASDAPAQVKRRCRRSWWSSWCQAFTQRHVGRAKSLGTTWPSSTFPTFPTLTAAFLSIAFHACGVTWRENTLWIRYAVHRTLSSTKQNDALMCHELWMKVMRQENPWYESIHTCR